MTPDEMYVRMLLAANGKGQRHRPLLDLSEVPSQAARAGLMSPSLEQYQPTWGDYGRAAEGMARDVVTDAPKAIVDAAEDPSLAKITNAGVRTALSLGQFGKAGLVAAGGLGAGLANDTGIFGMEAVADDGERDPLDPSQRKRLTELQAKQAKGGRLSRAEREEQSTYLATLKEAALRREESEAKKREMEDKAKRDEYDRALTNAEAAKKAALDKDYRFQDTDAGKIWSEISGVAPFLGAGILGAVSRWGTGPGKSLAGKAMKDYVLPIVAGTGGAFAAQNLPLFADMNAPSSNPQREAMIAYAREMMFADPKRSRQALDFADKLPENNPVQEQAYEQFNDGLWKRLGVAGIEGLTFGKAGASLVSTGGRINDWAKDKWAKNRSAREGGSTSGQTPLPPEPVPTPPAQPSGTPPVRSPHAGNYGSYPKLPKEVRQDLRSEYADEVAANGMPKAGKPYAEELTKMLRSMGVNVDVPARRVNAINRAVRDFMTANGRMPTRDEIMKLFNDKTLAVPAAVGAGGLFALPGDEQ